MWGTILKIAAGLLITAAISYGLVKIYQKITADRIREEVNKIGTSDAFKAMIKSKTTKRVDVGIFNRQEEEIGTMTIESEEGVDKNLYVGQTIRIAS